MNRIEAHPILDVMQAETLTFTFDGRPLSAKAGDTIAAALTAHGIRVFRTTAGHGRPRGLYCAIGQCTDCIMVVDGQPNVRACVTPVREGMAVCRQHGLGGSSDETR